MGLWLQLAIDPESDPKYVELQLSQVNGNPWKHGMAMHYTNLRYI